MNKSDFILTGGYPLKAERLQELQTAFSIFNALGALAGDLTIISGCTLSGSTIGNGFVYINGELFEFREADVSPTSSVIVIEEAVNRGFKNGTVKQVHTIRYATFGTADTSWLWTNFKRVDPITVMMARLDTLEKKSAVFQAGGGMVLWNKPAADIPTGWAEVVDWRGRMPVGFDASQPEFNTMGKSEGSKNKTLSIEELPRFRLKINGKVPQKVSDIDRGDRASSFSLDNEQDLYTDYIGNDKEFSLLNPYRVVLFIEYIG